MQRILRLKCKEVHRSVRHFSESFLAYIGLGIAPPEPSIGILLSDGQNVLLQYPYQTFFPAVLISLLMIAFNMFANGLRDALDPTKRGEE